MRPRRLTIEGFRSYQGRVTFDFAERRLLGIVGPTGAGKSSILDAITFALYGRTPAEGRSVTKLINSRSAAAQVELWFEAAGSILRATRTVRRQGASGQSLERWDALDGEKLETLADKRSDLNGRVEALLGLDFDAFTRSLLLAQGRFAQLLAAPPAEAARVLTGLFGFGVIEEMRSITAGRVVEVRARLEAAETARREQERLAGQAAEAALLAETNRAKVESLRDIAGRVAEVDGRLGDLRSETSEARDRIAALGRLEMDLPDPEAVEAAIAAATARADKLAAVTTARDAAHAALGIARAAMDAAVGRDVQAAIARLGAAIVDSGEAEKRLLDARRAVDSAGQRLTAEREAAEEARVAERVARNAVEEADARRARAEDRLAVLETAHAAHTLGRGLAAGDSCPVCARALDRAPELHVPRGLDEALAEVEAANSAADSAAKAATTAAALSAVAAQKVSSAEAEVERLESESTKAEAALDTARDVVRASVAAVDGDPSDPQASLAAATEAWDATVAAREAATAAAAEQDALLAELTGVDADANVAALVAAFRPVADAVGADLPSGGYPDLAEGFRSIRAALGTLITRTAAGLAEAEKQLASAEAERSGIVAGSGIEPGADVAAALRDAEHAHAGAHAKAELLAEQVAKGAAALAAAEETAVLAHRLQRLNTDLAPGKFPQFLLDERRRELGESGSEWLRQLSAGRYEFVLEDNLLRIRELTAAGMVRDADTLSGGETFLASLALALGLATMVGMGGGALDSFFIDEGFGSLDADSLDLAMEGVERLVAGDGDRLVVVVSHVPELRERLDDLIVLAKDPGTGATVVERA